MILILLGTFDIEFSRPLVAVHELCKTGVLCEEIIVQNGFTRFDSPFFTYKPFINQDELNELYQKARLIITHAGTGSILKGVKMGKKVIAIARLKKYMECVDDHQLEILDEFSKLKFIYPWNENDSLSRILKNVEMFTPNVYVSQKQKIINYLDAYVKKL